MIAWKTSWLNRKESKGCSVFWDRGDSGVKTATEVGVRAIQDHKVIEWNTYWKCRLSEGTDDI